MSRRTGGRRRRTQRYDARLATYRTLQEYFRRLRERGVEVPEEALNVPALFEMSVMAEELSSTYWPHVDYVKEGNITRVIIENYDANYIEGKIVIYGQYKVWEMAAPPNSEFVGKEQRPGLTILVFRRKQ